MNETEVAEVIYKKILASFPEASSFVDQDVRDLAYLSMGYFAEYLETLPDCVTDRATLDRLKVFADWACNYPRGNDSSDDVLTIFTVGFLEKLFESEKLHRLVPHLIDREDVIANKEYWITWVGSASYAQTLSAFEQKVME